MKRDGWYPKGTLEKPFVPQEISDVMLAFPANVAALMPPVEDIPDEFAGFYNKWFEFANAWFFHGLKEIPKTKEGINGTMALRHLSSILGSWEPKHEYKCAAVGFLASLWFEEADSYDAR